MKKISVFLLLAFFAFSISSCDREDPKATIEFQHFLNGTALNFEDTYEIGTDSTLVNFDIAQFYVNNIILVQDGGGETAFDGHYLISTTNRSIDLGTIELAEYTSINFDVGVHPDNNHIDPTTLDSDDALAPKSPTMNWGWTAGYKFLSLDGTYDSDGDLAITDTDSTFLLHIGLDEYLQTATVVYPFESFEDETNELVIKVDYANLFDYAIEEKPETKTIMPNEHHNNIVGKVPTLFSK